MKKMIESIVLVLALCVCMAVPAMAENGFVSEYARVLDMADLLSDGEEEALTTTLDNLSVRRNMDVIVVTTNDLEGKTVRDYADDVYDTAKFGYGSNRDGVLLLISMADRDWYISTCGYGITVFTDAGIQYIGDQIKSDLSDENYAAAFDTYAVLCDDFISQAKTGEPYDNSNLPREPLSLIWIPVSIAIGVVLALLVVGVMKGQLKSVRSQAAANSYLKPGSLNVTESRDLFLYSQASRTEKPKDNDSGSSTHTSSSGTTHGGGGGKF